MVMRFDPFRELDRLAERGVGASRPGPMLAMDAYRRGEAPGSSPPDPG
jgi:hypothetical protein